MKHYYLQFQFLVCHYQLVEVIQDHLGDFVLFNVPVPTYMKDLMRLEVMYSALLRGEVKYFLLWFGTLRVLGGDDEVQVLGEAEAGQDVVQPVVEVGDRAHGDARVVRAERAQSLHAVLYGGVGARGVVEAVELAGGLAHLLLVVCGPHRLAERVLLATVSRSLSFFDNYTVMKTQYY